MTAILLMIGAGALCVAGVALAGWSLFGDRSRARRCHGCWYSMEGVPGLRCPECGREATREQTLTKRRRRWRWAACGGVSVIAGALLLHLNVTRQQGGWWSLAPTGAIAIAYRFTGDDGAAQQLATRMMMSTAPDEPGPASSLLRPAIKRAAIEASQRTNSGPLHELIMTCAVFRPHDTREVLFKLLEHDDIKVAKALAIEAPCFFVDLTEDECDRYVALIRRCVSQDPPAIERMDVLWFVKDVELTDDELRTLGLIADGRAEDDKAWDPYVAMRQEMHMRQRYLGMMVWITMHRRARTISPERYSQIQVIIR